MRILGGRQKSLRFADLLFFLFDAPKCFEVKRHASIWLPFRSQENKNQIWQSFFFRSFLSTIQTATYTDKIIRIGVSFSVCRRKSEEKPIIFLWVWLNNDGRGFSSSTFINTQAVSLIFFYFALHLPTPQFWKICGLKYKTYFFWTVCILYTYIWFPSDDKKKCKMKNTEESFFCIKIRENIAYLSYFLFIVVLKNKGKKTKTIPGFSIQTLYGVWKLEWSRFQTHTHTHESYRFIFFRIEPISGFFFVFLVYLLLRTKKQKCSLNPGLKQIQDWNTDGVFQSWIDWNTTGSPTF